MNGRDETSVDGQPWSRSDVRGARWATTWRVRSRPRPSARSRTRCRGRLQAVATPAEPRDPGGATPSPAGSRRGRRCHAVAGGVTSSRVGGATSSRGRGAASSRVGRAASSPRSGAVAGEPCRRRGSPARGWWAVRQPPLPLPLLPRLRLRLPLRPPPPLPPLPQPVPGRCGVGRPDPRVAHRYPGPTPPRRRRPTRLADFWGAGVCPLVCVSWSARAASSSPRCVRGVLGLCTPRGLACRTPAPRIVRSRRGTWHVRSCSVTG